MSRPFDIFLTVFPPSVPVRVGDAAASRRARSPSSVIPSIIPCVAYVAYVVCVVSFVSFVSARSRRLDVMISLLSSPSVDRPSAALVDTFSVNALAGLSDPTTMDDAS